MIDELGRAICTTVKQFQEHPLDFLSERDIQALLFVELRNATRELRYSYDGGGKNHRFGFPERFCVHPVTTEYHVYKGKNDCFDIAVLSEEPDPKSDIWRQPCRIAIEIKLWQPGYGKPKYRMDVEKLRRYQEHLQKAVSPERVFMGIAMLFVHPYGTQRPTAIIEERSGDAYPEDGIALHLVTKEGHWWKQFPGPASLQGWPDRTLGQ
jgi:hypothetical protein